MSAIETRRDQVAFNEFEINGHFYFAFRSIEYTSANLGMKKLRVVIIKDAAGKMVAKTRSGKGTDAAFKSAKRKTELYACELVSSPAQAVSEADMVKAIETPAPAAESLTPSLKAGDSVTSGGFLGVGTISEIIGDKARVFVGTGSGVRTYWLRSLKPVIASIAEPAESEPEALDHRPLISKGYDKTVDRVGYDGSNCILCGRHTNDDDKTAQVHVSFDTGGLVATDNGNYKFSQGFFPIGSDCAKKLPKRFLFNF